MREAAWEMYLPSLDGGLCYAQLSTFWRRWRYRGTVEADCPLKNEKRKRTVLGYMLRDAMRAAAVYTVLPIAIFLALIVDFVIRHPTVSVGMTGATRWSMIGLSIIVAIALGLTLVEQERHARDFLMAITVRTIVAILWWPMLAVARQYPHQTTAIGLGIIGIALTIAAVTIIYSVGRRRQLASYLAYGLAGLSMLVFAAFLQGHRELSFEKDQSGIVHVQYDVWRWFDSVKTESHSLSNITVDTRARLDDHFDGMMISGIVISSGGESIPIPGDGLNYATLGNQLEEQYEQFEEGTERQLQLKEDIPYARFQWSLLFAVFLLWYGIFMDPITVNAYWGPRGERIGRPERMKQIAEKVKVYASCGLLVAVVIALPVIYVSMFSTKWKNDAKVEAIAEKFGEAESADFVAEGETIIGNATRIKINPLGFSDHDAVELNEMMQGLHLIQLDLSGTKISDAGLRKLSLNSEIIALTLVDTEVTKKSLDTIAAMSPMLLDVRGTAIKAEDFNGRELPSLEYLYLTDRNFDRRSVRYLLRRSRLKYAFVEHAKLTESDLEFWKHDLVDLKIEWSSESGGDRQAESANEYDLLEVQSDADKSAKE